MFISIIIPSYNGALKLPNLLASVKEENLDTFEIIVVLDGSTDNSLQVIQEINLPNLKAIIQKNGGRSKARNAGAEAATGDILFFVDDDIRLFPGVLKNHLSHHYQFNNTVLLGKVVMDQNKLTTDFNLYVNSLITKWDSDYQKKTIINEKNLKFTTQHVSMLTSLFEKVGGFDERLTDAEDFDLAMRILAMNAQIFYDPEIKVFHDDFASCKQYIKRQIEYKKSHQQLKDLNKQYPEYLFPPLIEPSKRRKFISRLFSSDKWVDKVDNGLLLKIPQKLRYKLYSEILYAHTLAGMGLL